jgi:hypothetical protein
MATNDLFEYKAIDTNPPIGLRRVCMDPETFVPCINCYGYGITPCANCIMNTQYYGIPNVFGYIDWETFKRADCTSQYIGITWKEFSSIDFTHLNHRVRFTDVMVELVLQPQFADNLHNISWPEIDID